MDAPVYAYYKLTNFYQNHRRYVRSRNDEQLRGNNPSFSSMEDCDPRRSIGDENDPTKYWNPCGLIAASMFNGKLVLLCFLGFFIPLFGSIFVKAKYLQIHLLSRSLMELMLRGPSLELHGKVMLMRSSRSRASLLESNPPPGPLVCRLLEKMKEIANDDITR